MQTQEYELVVSSGKRPLWKIVVAALLFTVAIFSLYQFAMACIFVDLAESSPKLLPGIIERIALCASGGFYLSVAKTVLIDTDKDQLISRFSIGPFSKDVITTVPQLEYVAVFKNQKEIYEVNLWYKGNKHYKMFAFEQNKMAFQFANMVSQKLKLDLLDGKPIVFIVRNSEFGLRFSGGAFI